ncbi:MAG: response regulator [Nitrospiraceae bacterium]|nr:MAG: response regulator [Nitrospiraceae bacterium]
MEGIDSAYTKKVLIVDDEPYIVRVLKLKLEHAGYEVLTAVNGIDGMEKFVREKPAVVISDIKMPLVDGQELYNMMMHHKSKEPYFVIAMTSSVDNSLQKWASELSNVQFVEKPFSPSNILKVVNEYFSKLQESNAAR